MRAAIAIVISFAWLASSADKPRTVEGKIKRIVDADTFVIETIVRLEGGDAPELKQRYGLKAKQFAEERLLGRQARWTPKYRSYNRYVSPLTVDGRDVALMLAKAGQMWVDPRYNKRKDLVAAQKEARDELRGLWGEPPCIAPWEWRREH